MQYRVDEVYEGDGATIYLEQFAVIALLWLWSIFQ